MLNKFYDLYKLGVSVEDLSLEKSKSPLLKIYKTKIGDPVKYFNIKKHIHYYPTNTKFSFFFRQNPEFWMFPISTENHIFGFQLRSYYPEIKNYCLIKGEDKESILVYGLHTFKEFKKGDPIILTEGIHDVEYLNKFYPFVLGLVGNPSKTKIKFVKALTNSVVFAFDNDDAGNSLSEKLTKEFIFNKRLKPMLKDWGKHFFIDNVDNDKEEILNSLKFKI